jgi:hypothetical protein
LDYWQKYCKEFLAMTELLKIIVAAELGDTFTDDDFSDNRINSIFEKNKFDYLIYLHKSYNFTSKIIFYAKNS